MRARTYCKIHKELGWYAHVIKRHTEMGSWPIRGNRYVGRQEALEEARARGYIIVNRWYDANIAEEKLMKFSDKVKQMVAEEGTTPLGVISECHTYFVQPDYMLAMYAREIIEELIDELVQPEPQGLPA